MILFTLPPLQVLFRLVFCNDLLSTENLSIEPELASSDHCSLLCYLSIVKLSFTPYIGYFFFEYFCIRRVFKILPHWMLHWILQHACTCSGKLYFWMYGKVSSEQWGFEAQSFYCFTSLDKYPVYNKQLTTPFIGTIVTIIFHWHACILIICLWLVKMLMCAFEIPPIYCVVTYAI